MGVKYFYTFIKNKINENINSDGLFFIDGNCLIHDYLNTYNSISNFDEKIKEICKYIITYFKLFIDRYKMKEENIYLFFDGIPPTPKIVLQKKRRIKELQNENSDFRIFILPNTNILNSIEEIILLNFPKIILFSNKEIGEGEQKMIIEMKKIYDVNLKKIYLISLDSDIFILAYLQNLQKEMDRLYIIFFQQNKDKCISVNNFIKKYKNNNFNFTLLAAISGNDFFEPIDEKMTFLTLYDFFSKKNIKNFKDFYKYYGNNKKCKCKCKIENIENYLFTYFWYDNYFKTNEMIDFKEFKENSTNPCIKCLSFYEDKYKIEWNNKEKLQIENNPEKHLKYVLGYKINLVG